MNIRSKKPIQSTVITKIDTQDSKNYKGTSYGIAKESKVITRLGAFGFGVKIGDLQSRNLETDIVAAPGDSYLDKNNRVEEFQDKYKTTQYSLGYGLKLDKGPFTIKASAGHLNHSGETPHKSTGEDARIVDVKAYQGKASIESTQAFLGVKYKTTDFSMKNGYPLYDFFISRNSKDFGLKYDRLINDDSYYHSGFSSTKLQQKINFEFKPGVPTLFPPKTAESTINKIKIGYGKLDILGQKKIEAGLTTYFGDAIPSIMSVPIKYGAKSTGIYFEIDTKNLGSLSLEFSQYQAKGLDTYFSTDDNFESETNQSATLKYTYGPVEIIAEANQRNRTTKFVKPTPVDSMLAKYPNGASKTSHSNDLGFNAGIQTDINNSWSVGVNYVINKRKIDQYGIKNTIDGNSVSLNVGYKF